MATPIIIAADVLSALAAAAQAIQTLEPIIQKMIAQGRSQLTPEEWQAISNDESGAAQSLLQAIQARKAAGG